MPTTKRIDGDYTISTLNAADNVVVNTHTVDINGNLDVVGLTSLVGNVAISGNLNVAGNLTYINVSELNIRDPFILVNASNTGTYAANSGILTHTSNTVFAGIRYNSIVDAWQASDDTDATGETGLWLDIALGNVITSAAGNIYQIQFNAGAAQDFAFAANANFTFDAANSAMALQGNLVLGNVANSPSATANSVTLFHNAQGAGGTGVYVKSNTVEDELVSKNTAMLFSIIF
jgi:hypothetical protein